MSDADKRTVSTDALETLGNLIGPNEKRDAIHLAVIPCIAGEFLRAGEHVEVHKATEKAFACAPGEGVGVVDPFLVRAVKPDERFWLVIYPRTIHSLRHVWTHPAFPDEPGTPDEATKTAAQEYLKDYAERLGIEFDDLIEMAPGSRFTRDIEGPARNVPPVFWQMFEAYTGRKLDDRLKTDWFSCGC